MDAMQSAIVLNRQQTGVIRTDGEMPPAVHRAQDARDLLINQATAILDELLIKQCPSAECLDANLDADSAFTAVAPAECDEDYWLTNEGLTSERIFHGKLYYLVSQLTAAYMQDDLLSVNKALRSIIWVNKMIDTEPLQSVYTTGLILGMLNLARYCSDHFEIQSGYRLAQQCSLLLDAKRERRKALGLAFRPDSECWYRLFEILAELKWKGPESMRDLMMSPEMLIEDFVMVEQRCFDYLDRNPSSDSTRDNRVKEALLWCRLQIIKMAIKIAPDKSAGLIEGFNQLHGALLSQKPGDFMFAAQVDRCQAWYWDFELFKWCTLGEGGEEEAMMCHQWRLDAMRSRYNTTCCLKTYERATRRELEYLLKRQPTAEVIVGS